MFCSNCGAQVTEEANYCWKCGHPQKPDIKPATTDNVFWETCEIVWMDTTTLGIKSLFSKWKLKFWARALGPKGVYNAGETDDILGKEPSMYSDEHQKKLQELVGLLLKDGWKPAETNGNAWFSFRFRRRVASPL